MPKHDIRDLSMTSTFVLQKMVELGDEAAIMEKEKRIETAGQHWKLWSLANHDDDLGKLMAGQIRTEDFFTNPKYQKSKDKFIAEFTQHCPELAGSKFSQESLAAAWLTKLRFNDEMTDRQFVQHIQRAEQIFFIEPDEELQLDLINEDPDKNDNISIQWGIEALNGVQSMDSGVTRVRFPDGVGPKIYQAFKDAGAPSRSSTHAHCTRLEDGIGKDVVHEDDRRFTPRGAGHILMLATSKNGSNQGLQAGQDHDLVLKREDYGFRDKISHTIRHAIGGLKKWIGYSSLIDKKSKLAKECEKKHGKGPKIHRKEHLSELKTQSASLIALLEAGKKQEPDLFPDFKTVWKFRVALPPIETKIVSASDDKPLLGMGEFLKVLAEKQEALQSIPEMAAKLDDVKSLLDQAQAEAQAGNDFAACREGNEVLVNCVTGKPQPLDALAKNTDNTAVNRAELVEAGVVTSDSSLLSGEDRQQYDVFEAIHQELEQEIAEEDQAITEEEDSSQRPGM